MYNKDINTDSLGVKFRKLWFFYILQSLLAGLAILLISLLLGNAQERFLILSSMGGTAFIVFALPHAYSAQTRNVLGGHLIGLLAGGTILTLGLPTTYSFSIGLSIAVFLMVALDAEHPPAAATCLAVLNNEVDWNVIAAVLTASLILSQLRYYLRNRLKDLL